MRTNEIKKGTEIRTRQGFKTIMADNMKGNIRMVKVDGICGEEIGSMYAHDILEVLVDGKWVAVEHTKEQEKLSGIVDALLP